MAWYRLQLFAHLLIMKAEKNKWLWTEFLCNILVVFFSSLDLKSLMYATYALFAVMFLD
jgi:fumarate reductase subunit C